jgi:GrpB-like predicted nucleotidyltransferase (UPF0157 family)
VSDPESPAIVVVEYDPAWAEAFERVRDTVWPALHDVALAVEHVGSTSVPGLWAKPIVDVDVVVADDAAVTLAIARLAGIGYVHRDNFGLTGREAFEAPRTDPTLPPHHLYVCPQGSVALRNHLAVRDHLRAFPASVRAYGALKRRLARAHPHDIDAYVAGKTDFVLAILRAAGFESEELGEIERINRSPMRPPPDGGALTS